MVSSSLLQTSLCSDVWVRKMATSIEFRCIFPHDCECTRYVCVFFLLSTVRSIQYSESRRTKKQTWTSLQKQLITQLSYHPMHMHSVYTMHVYRSSFRQFIENRSDLSCKSAKSTYATIRTSSHSQFYLSFLLIIKRASAHILLFLRNERKKYTRFCKSIHRLSSGMESSLWIHISYARRVYCFHFKVNSFYSRI